jgi:hypothetical protein
MEEANDLVSYLLDWLDGQLVVQEAEDISAAHMSEATRQELIALARRREALDITPELQDFIKDSVELLEASYEARGHRRGRLEALKEVADLLRQF